MNKSESISELAPALVAAQAHMGGAKKIADNPFFKSKYANLEEVIRVVKEAFYEHGLAFVQFPVSGDGMAGVETIIIHTSGQWISNQFLLRCAKSDPQGMGSAITYARRYGLQSAVGIPSEDDDGNAASAPDEKELESKRKQQEEEVENAVSEMKGALTLDDLKNTFTGLPGILKTHPRVTKAKDTRKSELTTKA